MTTFEQIETLKRQYTDKYVVVDAQRPELARFRDRTGQVKTVNMSGRALVQFDAHNDIGWYDINLTYLKVVNQPAPKEAEGHKARPGKETPAKESAKSAGPAKGELSAKPAVAKGTPAASPVEKSGGKPEAGKPDTGKKPSTADILAAARAAKQTSSQAAAPTVEKPTGDAPARTAPKDQPKMSTADILAAARAVKAGGGSSAPSEKPAPSAKAATEQPAPAPAAKVAATESPASKPDSPQSPASEKTAAATVPSKSPAGGGALPTDTAGKIAWCRAHPGKSSS